MKNIKKTLRNVAMIAALSGAAAGAAAADTRPVTELHKAVCRFSRGIIGSDVFKAVCAAQVANVNAACAGGQRPLHWAISQHCCQAAQILLEHGADKEARTDWGDTPIQLAVKYSAVEIVTLLMKLDVDWHVKDAAGNSLLHLAAKACEPSNTAIYEVLFNHPAFRKRSARRCPNQEGETPIWLFDNVCHVHAHAIEEELARREACKRRRMEVAAAAVRSPRSVRSKGSTE